MALEEPLSLYTLLSKYNDLLENYETLKASYEDLLANVNTQQEEIDYIYDNGVQSLGEVTASATTLDEGSSASVGVTSEKKKNQLPFWNSKRRYRCGWGHAYA